MPLIDFHSRCRDTEAALRGRVSDLEEVVATLYQRLEAQHEAAVVRERELMDRYTALLNPAAATLQARNRRIEAAVAVATTAPSPHHTADDTPDRPDDPPPPPVVYRDRDTPVRRMPVFTPHAAGYRPVRVPVQVMRSAEAAPEPEPNTAAVAFPGTDDVAAGE